MHTRGFSLLELLVVVGIFAFITTVSIASYNRFNSETLFTNLAVEIALSLREAQSYSIGARPFGGSFIGSFGMHFAEGQNMYTFFADANGDRTRAADGSEDIDVFSLQRGYVVENICVTVGTGSEECNPTISTLDIVFTRPGPDAIINGVNNANARVVLGSTSQSERQVSVLSTGQISVSKNAVPVNPVFTWQGPLSTVCSWFPQGPSIPSSDAPGGECTPMGADGYVNRLEFSCLPQGILEIEEYICQ